MFLTAFAYAISLKNHLSNMYDSIRTNTYKLFPQVRGASNLFQLNISLYKVALLVMSSSESIHFFSNMSRVKSYLWVFLKVLHINMHFGLT